MPGGDVLGHSWTEEAPRTHLVTFLVTPQPLLQFMAGICKVMTAAASREWAPLKCRQHPSARSSRNHLWHWLGSLAFQMSQTTGDRYVGFFISAGGLICLFLQNCSVELQNTFGYESSTILCLAICIPGKNTWFCCFSSTGESKFWWFGFLVQMNRKMQTAFKPSKNTDSHSHFPETLKSGESCQPGSYSAVSLPSSKTYYHFKSLCQAYSSTGQ